MKDPKLSNQAISSLCLELTTLLHAGVSTADAIHLLAQETDEHGLKPLLEELGAKVDGGAPLAAAMAGSHAFPAYVTGLVDVGERSGRSEEALAALARYYEDRARLERRVRSALLYPAVMLLVMLLVIGVLLVQVLPIFDDVYASLGGRLTGVAAGLLTLGRWLDAAMPVLCALLLAAVVLVGGYALIPAFRARVTALLRRGGDKGVRRKMNNARVAQAMAMGMRSGLAAEEALALAAGLLDDAPAAKARCERCIGLLDGGTSLSHALRETQLLEPAQCRLLELSQRSGAGDSAMEHIAAALSEDADAALEEQVSRVEPTLVLVSSVLVGLVLLSVMLPLMHIMSAIG